MKFATIERQAIEDGREFDVVTAFAETGVQCGDNVQIGDLYIGGGFQPRSGVLLAATLPQGDTAPPPE